MSCALTASGSTGKSTTSRTTTTGARREIMAMTRDKRQTYIDVLADAIEGLNDGG